MRDASSYNVFVTRNVFSIIFQTIFIEIRFQDIGKPLTLIAINYLTLVYHLNQLALKEEELL